MIGGQHETAAEYAARLDRDLGAWLGGRTEVGLTAAVRAANARGDATGVQVAALLRQRGYRKVGFTDTGYDRTPLYRRGA